MAGLMNMFDVSGQGGQMFNAGMQVGRLKSPVAGLGDSIRQVMERGRALRDQQMQAGQTMMQTQFTQDVKTRADADKIARMQKLGGETEPELITKQDPASGRWAHITKSYDPETGMFKYNDWSPLTTPGAEQQYKDDLIWGPLRAKQEAARNAALNPRGVLNTPALQTGIMGMQADLPATPNVAQAATPMTQDQKREYFQESMRKKLQGK